MRSPAGSNPTWPWPSCCLSLCCRVCASAADEARTGRVTACPAPGAAPHLESPVSWSRWCASEPPTILPRASLIPTSPLGKQAHGSFATPQTQVCLRVSLQCTTGPPRGPWLSGHWGWWQRDSPRRAVPVRHCLWMDFLPPPVHTHAHRSHATVCKRRCDCDDGKFQFILKFEFIVTFLSFWSLQSLNTEGVIL